MFYYEYLFVRTSLLWLLVAGVLGVLFYLDPGLMGAWRSVHVHAGVVGFFMNMVFGVAYWMMPRPGQIKQPGLEALTFWTLNLGLLLRGVLEPLAAAQGYGFPLSAGLLLSALLQLFAMVVFVYAMSRRVVTNEMLWRMRKLREEQKKR